MAFCFRNLAFCFRFWLFDPFLWLFLPKAPKELSVSYCNSVTYSFAFFRLSFAPNHRSPQKITSFFRSFFRLFLSFWLFGVILWLFGGHLWLFDPFLWLFAFVFGFSPKERIFRPVYERKQTHKHLDNKGYRVNEIELARALPYIEKTKKMDSRAFCLYRNQAWK